MIKENKLKVAISLFVTILPMIVGLCFWGKISEGYEAVMRSVKIMAVFVIPSIMLAFNVLCILITHFDVKRNAQHKKIISSILWIIPSISVYTSLVFYSVLLGWNVNLQIITALLFGVLFIVMGNYMPKSKQNRTFGVKIRWTLANEDNWNATHRFTGKIWFFGGFFVILIAFLPIKLFIATFIVLILLLAFIPVFYSYFYYKSNLKLGKQRAEDYDFTPKPHNKVIAIISIAAVSVILAACAVLMFTGSVEISLTESSLEIEASYHSDKSIPYADIDSIEYRDNSDKGMRIMGFSSARLLLGTFKNDELGAYTRFSYTKCKSDVIITVGESKFAISCETEAQTRALYEALLQKLEK